MVNHAAAAEAARLLEHTPGLGVGLHVALSGGRPTLPPDRVPSLVDSQGRLPAQPDRLAEAEPKEIRAEARAQLEIFRELVGRMPTHLDSHHHAHRLPGVLDAVIELAREHALPVRKASPEVGERLAHTAVPTTDHFVEDFFGEQATLEVLLGILRSLPEGTTELMCHPAVVDAELRAGSSYVEPRARELAVLTDPEARRACDAAGIALIHFGRL